MAGMAMKTGIQRSGLNAAIRQLGADADDGQLR